MNIKYLNIFLLVPGAPADIKAVVMSSDTILVSWKPPLHSNGIITKFTLYWRSLAKVCINFLFMH